MTLSTGVSKPYNPPEQQNTCKTVSVVNKVRHLKDSIHMLALMFHPYTNAKVMMTRMRTTSLKQLSLFLKTEFQNEQVYMYMYTGYLYGH